jgi:hypothetical protein
VGAFVSKHFAAGWRKVGTFAIVGRPEDRIGARKVGGNVAAYFCTPDLRVLGAVGGPVPPEVFLREAERAVALAERTLGGLAEDAGSVVETSHETRMASIAWNQQSMVERDVYQILKESPLAPLDLTYRAVFEDALHEAVSDAPVRYEEAWLNARRAGRNR